MSNTLIERKEELAVAVNDATLTIHEKNRDELLAELRRTAVRLGLAGAVADIDRIEREATDDIQRKLRYVSARLLAHRWEEQA